MSEFILKARDLNKFYTQRAGRFGFGTKTVKALDNVSLELRHASTLAVVGESGSGKSTLARCLLQLQPLDGGSVLFQGRDLADLPASELRKQRRHLQMIFQDPFASLNPRMTVGEIVSEGLLIHHLGDREERHQKTKKMLERVGLKERFRKHFTIINVKSGSGLPFSDILLQDWIHTNEVDNNGNLVIPQQKSANTHGKLNVGGDVTAYMAEYLGILSTEYWLLKYDKQESTDEFKAVLNELYFVINAIERLDQYSEKYYESKNVILTPTTDGFFVRDDAPPKVVDAFKMYDHPIVTGKQIGRAHV